jgi:hypothetical protein
MRPETLLWCRRHAVSLTGAPEALVQIIVHKLGTDLRALPKRNGGLASHCASIGLPITEAAHI